MLDMKDMREVRSKLGKAIQLELKDGKWLAHLNTDALRDDFQTPVSSHVVSGEEGIKLFNDINVKLGFNELQDPKGYMTLDGNMSEYIHRRYRERYEDTLDDIDAQIKDGTGHAVEAVLGSLSATVRHDMRQCLPEGMVYSDLRHVAMNNERQDAVETFITSRISKTLIHEKKRSYEASTIERTNQNLLDAGERIRETLRADTKDALYL